MVAGTTDHKADWRTQWSEQGFVKIEAFADSDVCRGMLERVVHLVRNPESAEEARVIIIPEKNIARQSDDPAELVSKIFRLHGDEIFREFALRTDLGAFLTEIIGPDVDVFLSQFIFKTPGAWGQPWHQDSYYFSLEPARPVVGVWLAVNEATLDNGCLHVLPGSQTEEIHEHAPDLRPGANLGYRQIEDHDMSASVPVLMNPGDLLIFDSHLMHQSTDNIADSTRAAMVYHYAAAGTVDIGPTSGNGFYDWTPAWRSGR